jgi:hypothetical protein
MSIRNKEINSMKTLLVVIITLYSIVIPCVAEEDVSKDIELNLTPTSKWEIKRSISRMDDSKSVIVRVSSVVNLPYKEGPERQPKKADDFKEAWNSDEYLMRVLEKQTEKIQTAIVFKCYENQVSIYFTVMNESTICN